MKSHLRSDDAFIFVVKPTGTAKTMSFSDRESKAAAETPKRKPAVLADPRAPRFIERFSVCATEFPPLADPPQVSVHSPGSSRSLSPPPQGKKRKLMEVKSGCRDLMHRAQDRVVGMLNRLPPLQESQQVTPVNSNPTTQLKRTYLMDPEEDPWLTVWDRNKHVAGGQNHSYFDPACSFGESGEIRDLKPNTGIALGSGFTRT
jgi:hypothetical protein